MAETVTQENRTAVLGALRGLNGRATLGDVTAATGVSRELADQSLRALLSEHRGHLTVGESGDLVWEFDPKLIRRDHESAWSRFKRGAKRFLAGAFKAWIVAMLVVYFIVFVALAVAAIVAVLSGDRRGGSRRGGRMRMRLPTWWLWYLFWSRDWRYGRPYYGQRWEQRHGLAPGKGGAPFYKKVFAFVLGPDEPAHSQEDHDRDLLALIRARRGVLTTAELMAHSGCSQDRAREELGRLMAGWEGDARVTDDGELVYVFPDLMVSAHGQVDSPEPPPAWRRLERPRLLTGNSTGTNAIVAGLNGFNLIASASAPWTIFPALGLSGPAATAGLVWVPLVFSSLFFLVPLARRVGVRRENADRQRRNIRRLLIGKVQERAIRGEAVSPESIAADVRTALDDKTIGDHVVADELGRLATELEADVEATPAGVAFRFPSLRRELESGERERAGLALETRRVGAIVYSSADTAEEEERRDLSNFDAELRRRLPSADRPAYLDE
jgi:hypothetical protein